MATISESAISDFEKRLNTALRLLASQDDLHMYGEHGESQARTVIQEIESLMYRTTGTNGNYHFRDAISNLRESCNKNRFSKKSDVAYDSAEYIIDALRRRDY